MDHDLIARAKLHLIEAGNIDPDEDEIMEQARELAESEEDERETFDGADI